MFSKFKNILNKILFFDTFGFIANASLIICVISGIVLAIVYNVDDPYNSIASILLLDPLSSFFRNLHYWSAQIFLIYSLLHIWEHLKKNNEKSVKHGVWIRLVISVLALFFVMISGFILKGDIESIQARNIIFSLFDSIPLIGNSLAFFLIGVEGDFELIYVHHIATASIFLIIIVLEHAKTLWTIPATFIYTLILTSVLSIFFTAELHDGLSPIIKGPWYLVGLQEILHWFSNPIYVVILITLFFFSFYFIYRIKNKSNEVLKIGILCCSFVYIILTLFAIFFRGENWQFVLPWNNNGLNSYKVEMISINDSLAQKLLPSDIPTILDRKEGCLVCHNDVKGFTVSHSPDSIGCSTCHLGNPFTLNKKNAHEDMILIPGNFTDVNLTCGNTNCHSDIAPRVKSSLMSTLSGMVSVNKFVFDELDSLNGHYDIKQIMNSASEVHLRNLCASCHLGNEKNDFGEITQLSRGGGCNACHLNYSLKAKQDLNMNKTANMQWFHSSISLNVSNDHCFGCHSRSGRISTTYEGWNETQLDSIPDSISNKYRKLDDGRIFEYVSKDVHAEYGMECIDCHNSYEVMGNGQFYSHKEEAVKIECVDCHPKDKFKMIYKSEIDYETDKIRKLRNIQSSALIKMKNSGIGIVNSYIDSNGASLSLKNSGKKYKLSFQSDKCFSDSAHKDLSCNSCHSSWVPQCIGCHTDYDPTESGYDNLLNKDVTGSWVEHVGEYYSDQPVLGIKLDDKGNRKIGTFTPGMILTIDKSNFDNSNRKIFKRLYAPCSPHSTTKNARSCKSCHNSSLAIGYGRGELKYKKNQEKAAWEFTPLYANRIEDNLPEDAWIGFLEDSVNGRATRENMRPFNLSEQKKILTVGSCLVCHEENSDVMLSTLINFEKVFKNRNEKCLFPSFN